MFKICIMEVREGQRTATLVMAVCHNASTQDRDMDMLEELLARRGEYDCLNRVHDAHQHINAAYRMLLAAYGQEVSPVIPPQDQSGQGPANGTYGPGEARFVGSERSIEDIEAVADTDARRARQFETRLCCAAIHGGIFR